MCCFDGLGLDIGRRGQCGACRRSVMCDARCKMHTMAAIWSKIEDNARGHGFRQGQGHGYGYTVPITTVPSFETKQSKVRSSESTLPQRPTQLHDLPSTFPNFESALPRFRSLDQLMRAVQMSESGHSDMQSASGALGGYGLRLRSPCSGLSIFGKDGHRIRLRHQLADSAERWMLGFYR